MTNNEFKELREKKDKDKRKGLIIGIAIGGVMFLILSWYMFKQNDIEIIAFGTLWYGISCLIIAATMQITKNME